MIDVLYEILEIFLPKIYQVDYTETKPISHKKNKQEKIQPYHRDNIKQIYNELNIHTLEQFLPKEKLSK